jgi:TonB family protein
MPVTRHSPVEVGVNSNASERVWQIWSPRSHKSAMLVLIRGDIVRFRRLIVLGLICVGASTYAQDEADIQAFNEAWLSYKAALQTPQVDLQIQSAKNVLDAARLIFDLSDERLPLIMVNYGRALITGKRHDEARTVLERSLELAMDIHGKDSAQLVAILSSLAETHNEFKDSDKQRYYKRAKKILERDGGKDSEVYAALMLNAGTDIYSSSDASVSKTYLQIARDSFLRIGGNGDFRAGVAAYYLAKVEFSRRKFKVSTTHLMDALPAFQSDDQASVKYQLHTRALLVQVYERRGKSDLATEHCVAIGRLSKLRGDQDYEPLFRMAPRYPEKMLSQGSEGFVDIAFTVDEFGFVRNPEVIRTGRRDRGFKRAAIEAVERFRYAPRFEDGEAVSVENVKTRITFELVN